MCYINKFAQLHHQNGPSWVRGFFVRCIWNFERPQARTILKILTKILLGAPWLLCCQFITSGLFQSTVCCIVEYERPGVCAMSIQFINAHPKQQHKSRIKQIFSICWLHGLQSATFSKHQNCQTHQTSKKWFKTMWIHAKVYVAEQCSGISRVGIQTWNACQKTTWSIQHSLLKLLIDKFRVGPTRTMHWLLGWKIGTAQPVVSSALSWDRLCREIGLVQDNFERLLEYLSLFILWKLHFVSTSKKFVLLSPTRICITYPKSRFLSVQLYLVWSEYEYCCKKHTKQVSNCSKQCKWGQRLWCTRVQWDHQSENSQIWHIPKNNIFLFRIWNFWLNFFKKTPPFRKKSLFEKFFFCLQHVLKWYENTLNELKSL